MLRLILAVFSVLLIASALTVPGGVIAATVAWNFIPLGKVVVGGFVLLAVGSSS